MDVPSASRAPMRDEAVSVAVNFGASVGPLLVELFFHLTPVAETQKGNEAL